jgi:hypothetical protein
MTISAGISAEGFGFSTHRVPSGFPFLIVIPQPHSASNVGAVAPQSAHLNKAAPRDTMRPKHFLHA